MTMGQDDGLTTAALLKKVQAGDRDAKETLAERYNAMLKLWAHGRLPSAARDLVDTSDLVQTTLMRAFEHVETFSPRREGAFLAYVRRILLNQIRDQARRAKRRPAHDEFTDAVEDESESPLEAVMGRESVARYERALSLLSERQREAVILRVELGLRYREVAEALNASSGNAARLIVARALIKLAKTVQLEAAEGANVPERSAE